jgi:hypothetical protein
MTSAREFARFEAETARLRDSMLAAFSSNQFAAVADALSVYRTLLADLVSRHRAATQSGRNSATGPSRRVADSPGREWDLLLRHLFDLAGSFSEQTPNRAWSDFCEFMVDISADAINLRSPESLRSYWQVASLAWMSIIREERDQETSGHQEALLNALKTVSIIARSRSTDWPTVRVVLAGMFVQLVKNAVDANAEEAAIRGVDFLKTSLTNDVLSRGRSGSSADGLIAAAAIVSYAWILFRAITRNEPDLPVLREHLTELARGDSAWMGLRDLRSEAFEASFSSAWWEIDLRGGIGGGVMVLPSYEAIVAIAMTATPPAVEHLTDSDFDQAASLRQTAQEIVDEAHPGVVALVSGLIGRAARYRDAMDEIVAVGERARSARLSWARLDPAKVEAFASSAFAEIRSQRDSSLASIFQERRTGSGLGAAIGFHGRLSKSFFVTEPRVYANPIDLAANIVRAIAAREEDAVLERLRDLSRGSTNDVAGFAAMNERRADGSPRSWCVITNDWDVAAKVAGEFSSVSRLRTGSLQGVPVSVFQSYSDGDAFSYLVDVASLSVVRGEGLSEADGDFLEEELAAAVSVSLDDSETSHTEGVASADGSPLVVAKILIGFSIEVGEDPRVIELSTN